MTRAENKREASDGAREKQALDAFVAVRPRLFGLAYRMLGSAVEAEDVVQDAWLRWQATDRSVVESPTAFLVTTTTRLAINVLQSARARRETYVGPWLPEPVDTSADPELGAERREGVELAVLVLLEKLTPTERAAYVLREAFDYAHGEIAKVLDLEEANVRQLVARAHKHIVAGRKASVSAAEQRRLLEAFIAAAQLGDRTGLESLLAADVASYTDGGGNARLASRVPVIGREKVARFTASFPAHFWTDASLTWIETNGLASVLVHRGDELLTFGTIDASESGIERIFWVMNPEKLRAFTRAPG